MLNQISPILSAALLLQATGSSSGVSAVQLAQDAQIASAAQLAVKDQQQLAAKQEEQESESEEESGDESVSDEELINQATELEKKKSKHSK